jgi:hypothetical protein
MADQKEQCRHLILKNSTCAAALYLIEKAQGFATDGIPSFEMLGEDFSGRSTRCTVAGMSLEKQQELCRAFNFDLAKFPGFTTFQPPYTPPTQG